MKITADHWLETARRRLILGGATMKTRRCVVIHFTAGATAQSSIDFWRKPAAKGASAHVVIDRDGTIYQCRPFDRTCGHAGESRWIDPNTGRRHYGMNACSIGIELANGGDSPELIAKWSNLAPVKAAHRNGGTVRLWEAYTEPQLAACTLVTRALVERYNLDDVTGHDCIAPERKNDPGPAFPMQALREACGLSGLPAVHR